MARKILIQKNNKRIFLSNKYKNLRKNLKNKIKDKNLSLEDRIKLQNKLNDLPRDSSRTRVRNRCQITGRPRAVYRKFGLSRIKIRELSMSGSLPGVVKASW
ncbi:MAG: 30S ribosomal protein S14 [Alphaproteobacteria bacterium MarineAlpha5_Bin9]|nr:MAG: 30S ribosomal protein S14 [Alphaproteobacteria bacterium MarineAlpha5_Bin9]|tara:strand:- start:4784 stop:5089 length:306 start_codon:yes stop_codon:yes gene_type:complete